MSLPDRGKSDSFCERPSVADHNGPNFSINYFSFCPFRPLEPLCETSSSLFLCTFVMVLVVTLKNRVFLFRYPGIGIRADKESLTPITTPDVLPSMLSLANIGIQAIIEGSDLSKAVRRPEKTIDRAALFMNVYYKAPSNFYEYRAIKTSQFIYVRSTKKAE